jgi:hypothetical protein
MKYNNLHCHTTNSDGQLTVQETIKFCEENNVGAVAFTDHDSVLSDLDIKYLKSYKGPVRWVSGIEISVGRIPEVDKSLSGLHMVGLFVDPTNEELKKFCKRAQDSRRDRMQRIVKNLKSIDIHITEQDCLEASGGEAVGRPHIVQAIMKYESNVERMEELYLEMKAEVDSNSVARKKVMHIQEQGDSQKPYMIFLSKDAYIPDIYVEYLFSPTWDECVSVIRNAGGLSFLAHYFSIANKVELNFIEKLIKEGRLDGVEGVYGLFIFKSDSEFSKEILLQQEKLQDISKRSGCLVSGGSDAHNYENWEEFVNTPEFAEKTVGLLDNILEQSDKDLGWYKS